MGNQNPYIEEEQTTQWPKEKVQKRSTKHTYKAKVRVTRTPLKHNINWSAVFNDQKYYLPLIIKYGIITESVQHQTCRLCISFTLQLLQCYWNSQIFIYYNVIEIVRYLFTLCVHYPITNKKQKQ